MASHTTVVEMPTPEGKIWQSKVAVDPGSLRGEFIMVVSTPWISTGVGTSVELLVETVPILRTWVDYIDSNARVTFDFTR